MRIAASILGLLLLPVLYTASTSRTLTILAQSSEQKPQKMVDQACSDSSKDCKPTVCWAGDKGDCSCFTCEYGKQTSHVICTKKNDDKRVLFDYVKENKENKERCPSLSMAPEKPAVK